MGMPFDDTGGYDDRHELIAYGILFGKEDPVARMDSSYLDESGDHPDWGDDEVEKVIAEVKELAEAEGLTTDIKPEDFERADP
jgi:hypothetical protein